MPSISEQNIKERLEICRKCPIYSPNRGICNSKLWLNPSTNDVKSDPTPGYIRGCGCSIYFKTRNINNHCIAGKW